MALHSHFNGHIGKDGAQIKEKENGKRYLVFDIATDYFEKGENKTQWVRVYSTLERHLGKFGQSLKKGSHIKVEGELRIRPYIGQDGNAHAAVDCLATAIEYVSNGKKKDGQNRQEQRQEQEINTTASMPAEQANPFPAPETNNDELPF